MHDKKLTNSQLCLPQVVKTENKF